MQRKSSLYSLLFTVFNDSVGWGIALTVFAPLMMSRTATLVPPDMSEATRNILLGSLIGSYALTQFFSMPLIGSLSDSFGRKRILEWTLFGAALSFFLSAFAVSIQSFTLLFASRLLAGLFSGNSGTAQASIADMSTERTKAKNLSLCGVVAGISWIVGPPMGGFLSSSNWISWFNFSTPFWIVGLIFIVNLIWLHFSYKETYQSREHHDWKQEIKDLRKLSKIPRMNNWLIITFLFYFGWFFFTPYFPTLLVLKFGFTQEGIGFMSAYLAIFFFTISLVMNRGLAEKVNSESLTLWTLLLLGCMMFATNYIGLNGWFVTMPFLGMGAAICWICTLAITSNLAGVTNQGKVFGISQSLSSLALFFAPLLTGIIAAYDIGLPMILGGVIFLLAGAFAFRIARR
jgi:DHA1 family tetracycline resistance protein-like MFS transporter